MVVFDGAGDDDQLGPLSVRFAPDADTLLERLAAEHRARERVLLVSSDATVLGTAGPQVAKLSSQTFFRDLEPASSVPPRRPVASRDKLDDETRARLERLRRGAVDVVHAGPLQVGLVFSGGTLLDSPRLRVRVLSGRSVDLKPPETGVEA